MAIVVVIGVLTTTAGTAAARLSLKVTPQAAFAPVNLRVSVTIEPNASNRTLAVMADSEDFYRSSEVPLEGDRAPHVVTVEFRGVPGGDYQITGMLIDQTGESRGIAQQLARVLSPATDR
jgi:hypothetical protein